FKNWFYALIAMSTVLSQSQPTKAILGYATVRDEHGKEMHKSAGNSIEFNAAAERIGAESMRWQYVTANPEQNLSFGFGPARDIQRRFFLIWWNVYNFFITYANLDDWQPGQSPQIEFNQRPVLDRWILDRLDSLIEDSTEGLNRYDASL